MRMSTRVVLVLLVSLGTFAPALANIEGICMSTPIQQGPPYTRKLIYDYSFEGDAPIEVWDMTDPWTGYLSSAVIAESELAVDGTHVLVQGDDSWTYQGIYSRTLCENDDVYVGIAYTVLPGGNDQSAFYGSMWHPDGYSLCTVFELTEADAAEGWTTAWYHVELVDGKSWPVDEYPGWMLSGTSADGGVLLLDYTILGCGSYFRVYVPYISN